MLPNLIKKANYLNNRKEIFYVHTGFWWGNQKDAGIDGRIILTWIFRKCNLEGAWIGMIWLRIGTGGGQI